MQREDFLEDYVVPIVEASREPTFVRLSKLFGTAFFIDNQGIFLTARHVLEKAIATKGENKEIGLNIKHPTLDTNLYTPIVSFEYAPEPFDIAIGKCTSASKSFYKQEKPENFLWLDIATIGYPEIALNVTSEFFNIYLRGMKGFVQRRIVPDELPSLRPHPECFELSFSIPNGMSGAPLFTASKQKLIGVCVGSAESETTIYSQVNIEDGSTKYKERVTRIEQYGIAHSIFPILDWRPKVLEGKSLAEAMHR